MTGQTFKIRNGKVYPYSPDSIEVSKTITFSVSNGTASEVCFTVTGAVLIKALYAEVTTVLSSNHTAAHFRLNDQSATPAITLATGTTLSSLPVGSIILKEGQVDVAVTALSSAAGVVSEPAVDNEDVFCPFVVVKKGGATTTIDYRYTSTNTPATGAMKVYAYYVPLSADGALV